LFANFIAGVANVTVNYTEILDDKGHYIANYTTVFTETSLLRHKWIFLEVLPN